MKSDIVIIGGGASGLMAAYAAARRAAADGKVLQVTVLEKMPRPARKIMITGKGRCNFTNLKAWNEFSLHVRTKPNFVKSAFYAFGPQDVIDMLEAYGLRTVVERGDRAYPASYHASDVVDTLVAACHSQGVKIESEFVVSSVSAEAKGGFAVISEDGRNYLCSKLIIATGGLSYPGTGSSGDGYAWATGLGHTLTPCFPSLTALVPRGYKVDEVISTDSKWHIDRSTPLSPVGQALCGQHLINVALTLKIGETEAGTEQGDLDFTDGGVEGPIGFSLSRKAVKAMINGSKVRLVLDLKPGVTLTELTARVKELWQSVDKDPRSARLREKEKCRIMLGKLMPWELIPGFMACHPEVLTLERRSRTDTKVWVNLPSIAKALKEWNFDIAGYVGWERSVVTAGGVSTDEVVAKTMESRLMPGLYFCGEVLDIDADTGGYNLQLAFSTGHLAGESVALKCE